MVEMIQCDGLMVCCHVKWKSAVFSLQHYPGGFGPSDGDGSNNYVGVQLLGNHSVTDGLLLAFLSCPCIV